MGANATPNGVNFVWRSCTAAAGKLRYFSSALHLRGNISQVFDIPCNRSASFGSSGSAMLNAQKKSSANPAQQRYFFALQNWHRSVSH